MVRHKHNTRDKQALKRFRARRARPQNASNIPSSHQTTIATVVRHMRHSMDPNQQPYKMEYDKYDYPHELWLLLPGWEIALKIGTFVPVIVFGTIGNWVLLVIIARNRALQTPTNLLLANMSAADFLMLVICPVLFMFNDFYQNFQLGRIGCGAEGFLEGAFLVTGVLNLCAVSYDRLTAIVLPTKTRITLRVAKILMVFTWLAGAAFATPLAVFRFYRVSVGSLSLPLSVHHLCFASQERQWRNYLETYCSENPNILPTYWHILIGTIVWLPLVVMVACYSAILWKLERYEAQVLRREHPICVSYKTRVAKTLFVVVLTFVVLRVPFTVMVFARHNMLKGETMNINQVEGSFSVLWYTAHYLIFLHAAVNPLIYGLTNANFRRAYAHTALWFGGARRMREAEALRKKAAGNQKAAHQQPHERMEPNRQDRNGVQTQKPTVARLFEKLQPRAPCASNERQRQAVNGADGPAAAASCNEADAAAAVATSTPVGVGRGWTWLNTAARLRGMSPTTTFMGSPMTSKATMVTNVKFTASVERADADVEAADTK